MANLRLKIIHEIQNICIYYYYFSFETFLNIVEKKQNNKNFHYFIFILYIRFETNVLSTYYRISRNFSRPIILYLKIELRTVHC